jgi:hypothetical protein
MNREGTAAVWGKHLVKTRPRCDWAAVICGMTTFLLVPTLLIGALRLELGDGTWEFAIAQRYLDGDRLYRDIDIYITPLSIYWNAFLLWLLPKSIATINVAILFSGVIIVSCLSLLVYRETFRNRAIAILFFISAMYLGVYHWPRASYSWNAVLFSTLGFVVVVRHDTSASSGPNLRSGPSWILAGGLLSTAIGFKQNIGILMMMATVTWIAYRELLTDHPSYRRALRQGAAFLLGACTVGTLIATDLVNRGGAAIFPELFWVKPKTYGEQLTVSFFSNFHGPVSFSTIPKWFLEQAALVALSLGLCVAVLLLGLQLLTRRGWHCPTRARWGNAQSDPRVGFWGILFIYSFLMIFPRADYPHVTFAIPFCLASLCILTVRTVQQAHFPPLWNAARSVAMVGCLAYSGVMVLELGNFAFERAAGRRITFSEFPARGTIAARQTVQFVHDVRAQIRRELTPTSTLLIAHPYGSFLYPYLGFRNPTKFDYFHGNVLIQSDVEAAASRIDAGQIDALLVEGPTPGSESLGTLSRSAMLRMVLKARIDRFELLLRR